MTFRTAVVAFFAASLSTETLPKFGFYNGACAASAFQPAVSHRRLSVPQTRPLHASYRTEARSQAAAASRIALTSTALNGKVWDKLRIDEDPPGETHWYMLNCVAGSELELLAQCRKVQPTLDPADVEKFVVPQERQLRSHGSKNVVDVKALYPGYVFAKLRLCPETYETIQKIPLTRSWMGTVHMKGMRRLPVVPVALNEDEVAKFKLLEEETDRMFEKYGDEYDGRGDAGEDLLHQYAGYEVDGMVKVLRGKHKGEDGVVKRLKNGKIKVRLYTYGTTFDEWYDVDDIRPMTDAEVLKGLTGPEGPIRQNEFDVSIGKKPKDYGRRGAVDDSRGRRSLRSDLYSSLGGGGGRRGGRNTREARQARGDTSRTDRFGRSRDEVEQEERNWREYREQQRAERREGTWGLEGDKPWMYEDTQDVTGTDEDDVLGDVDAQWGRGGASSAGARGDIRSGRQERRMRSRQEQDRRSSLDGGRGSRQWQSAGPSRPRRSDGIENAIDGDDDWMSFAGGTSGNDGGSKSETDDFFDSLLNELSDTLDSPPSANADSSSQRGGSGQRDAGSSDDDFFASLMGDLSDTLDTSADSSQNADANTQWGRGSGGRIGSGGSGAGARRQEQDWHSSLDGGRGSRQWQNAGPSRPRRSDGIENAIDGDDDWMSFAGGTSGNDGGSKSETDDFFDSLLNELSDTLDSPPSANADSSSQRGGSGQRDAGSSDDDFFASLMGDLSDTLDTSADSSQNAASGSRMDDNFFAGIEKDLNESRNVAEPAGSSPSSSQPASESAGSDDDFFASLEADLSEALDQDAVTIAGTSPDEFPDNFADNLLSDTSKLKDPVEVAGSGPSKIKGDADEGGASPSAMQDLAKLTIPVLKGMLRERGLKVSGKKAELIDRLQSH